MSGKSGFCEICGRGPFAVVAQHMRHRHPEWKAPHSTMTRFTGGCRCDQCREAHRRWQMERRTAVAAGASSCPDCSFRSSAYGVARHRGRVHGFVHGTPSSYAKGCRCDQCKVSRAKFARESQAARGDRRRGAESCEICGESGFAKLAQHLRRRHGADTSPAHGTESRYAYGCRCSECRGAQAAARRRYRRAQQEKLAALVEPGIYCGGCGRRFASALQQRRCERSHGIRHGRRFDAAANRPRRGCYGPSGGAHHSMHVCGNDAGHAMELIFARFGYDEILSAARRIPGAEVAVSYFALVLEAIQQRDIANRRAMASFPIDGELG